MENLAALAAAIGAGLVTVGASFGISNIGKAAAKSISRQPGASNEIRGSVILTSALIEGIALFALVICIIIALQ